MRIALHLGAAILLAAAALPGQTLEQAESLWKARRFFDANEAFKALVAKEPTNADYKVRWGRLFLDHGQPSDASDLFKEALELKQDCASAYVGLALIAADSFESSAAELAHKALEIDPKLLEAQELLARLALEDGDEAKATEESRKALQLNPNSVQAKAVLASMDFLADKKDSPWDPREARGYETAGHFLVMNRRYDEGIAFYRKAIALDPQLYGARSQLGINLMRMGQDEEAYKQLETCFQNDFQDAATRNSLKLLETLQKFDTFSSASGMLKMDRKEAALLRPYFESEMERAIDAYQKKYQIKIDKPIRVEVYPNHEDFAVRTLGVPGLGALGVTFGQTIAMDSPSGRKPGDFHWASTLWHEMSHVFTLTLTNSHVPRWFTEGLAVHDETASANPEWGDRMGHEVLMAIKEKTLLPIAELDRGFVHPKTPMQVSVSYFQGGRICDYITEKFGWNTILAMLHDFRAGEDTADVVRKELKMEPAEFDKQFLAYVEAAAKTPVENFENWAKQLKAINELWKAKDYDGVIRDGKAIRDLYPDYVEAGSVYEFLANAYLAKGDRAASTAELVRYEKAGGRDPEMLKQLAKQLEAAGDKKEAAAALDRINYIYPMDNAQHTELGSLWMEQGNLKGAIREFRATANHNPLDPAEAHYLLAQAYYQNHEREQAQDEVLTALEAAPAYRPAQKLLLELSASEEVGTPPENVNK